MLARVNAPNDDTGSDVEEVDLKLPINKIKMFNMKKEPLKRVKRSNPHSNLDKEYIDRKEKLMHPQWDTLDPTPDIQALFKHFDMQFFQGRLKSVSLEWSKHMYSCAGIAFLLRHADADVTIRLSEPLLKVCPRKFLVENMLHQMAHVYLYLLKIREPNGGHGSYFRKIASAINKVSGTNINTQNTVPEDIRHLKLHWWRCNGFCQDRGPFFGYVQTQTSNAPDSDVQWYSKHHELCGGTFMRIKDPDSVKKPKRSGSAEYEDCNVKRRRSSKNVSSANQSKSKWVAVDEEVMLQEYQQPVITLSSDEDDLDDAESCSTGGECNEMNRNITTEDKTAQIRQEIIEDSIDLLANDFEVIADVEDSTTNVTTTIESAESRTIVNFFGNTLLIEFKTDNDCQPSTSRYQDNPDNDIIKCFICEDKLPRRDYGQHLNGCAGISKKILPRGKALKKLSAISKEARPKRQRRPSAHTTRDILRNAGYTDAVLASITSDEEDDFLSISTVRRDSSIGNTAASNGAPEVLNISSEDENTIRYRQRNLYRTTRECPVCMEDVEESNMNNHLDICLLLKRSS